MSKEMQSPAAPERQPKKSGSAGYMVILAACVALFAVFGYFLRGNKLSPLVTGLAAVWFLYAAVQLLLEKLHSHAKTASAMLSSVVKYGAVIASILFLLNAAGVDTSTLLAAAGIASLIIGFAAQSLIEDVITGIFILFEGQYKIGDFLVLGDFRGQVIDIGVRTTTIEDAGGNRKIVNNSDIRNVQNRSRKDSYAVSKVSVSYDTKMSRLREVFDAHRQEIFERNSDVFEDMPNFNGIQEFQDSGILLHFSVKVAEKDIFRAQRVLNGELKELCDANGIEIPFPQVVVHKQQT